MCAMQQEAPSNALPFNLDSADNSDDWLSTLMLNHDEEMIVSVRSSSRSRSRSRSKSHPRIEDLKEIVHEAEDLEWRGSSSETEDLKEIFHEASPPTLPDGYIQDQIVLPVDYHHSKIGNGLPLIFKHRGACVSKTLMQIVDSVADGDSFYVGATVNPRKRWLGRDGFIGHCWRWSAMIMIAYTSIGLWMEKAAIRFAQATYPQQCVNKAPDSRGQAPGNNFIYVCC